MAVTVGLMNQWPIRPMAHQWPVRPMARRTSVCDEGQVKRLALSLNQWR